MIRLRLHGKAPARRPWALGAALLLAAAWVVWRLLPPPPVDRPASLLQRPAVEDTLAAAADAPAGPVSEKAAPEKAAPEKAAPEKAAPEKRPEPPEAAPEKQAVAAAAPAGETRVVVAPPAAAPRAGTDPQACLRVLDLADGVPAGIELVMVRGNAAGEFLFEGRAGDEAAAKALKRGVPGASMSYWRSQGRLNFTLQGVLRDEEDREKPPAGAGDWQQLARASGLRQLTVEAQPAVGGRGPARQKMWAQGSLEEVRRFAASVVASGGAVWREFVFDAASGGGGRLFVALETPAP